jgi:hypothetical protein
MLHALGQVGDLTAKDFIRDVIKAAKAGVGAAQHAAAALLTGTSVVAHVLALIGATLPG